MTNALNFDTRISSCSVVEAISFRSSISLRASVVGLMVGADGSKSTSWPSLSLFATTTTLPVGSSDSF